MNNVTEKTPLGMSNFDGKIDDGLAEALIAGEGKVYASHAAWNFNGKVYYRDGMFHEDVWRYHSLKETISAETLQELMSAVNDEYGYE